MILPQYYLKIESMEVVGVRDVIEPEATGRRMEENLLDRNVEVFDTILMGKTTEPPGANWNIVRTKV